MSISLFQGDCRLNMASYGPFDMLIADPPYGDTSLSWDKHCSGWIKAARDMLSQEGSMWVFGSMRFFMEFGDEFRAQGWKLAQDVVWEKHNGSSFHADRFKRVHEHIVQFYRSDSQWAKVYNSVQKTMDATARAVRRKKRPPHTGHIEEGYYTSFDGGPRIMRSVLYERSCHGYAIHPTEKPVALLEVLIRTSCRPGGVLGDMFAGSGAAGEAAYKVGRSYVGFEIDSAMAERANQRLSCLAERLSA